MIVKQIGERLPTYLCEQITFQSDMYLLDADVLVIDLDAIISSFYFTYIGSQKYLKNPSISEYDLSEYMLTFNERKIQIAAYLENGRSLFLYCSTRTTYTLDVGFSSETSSTQTTIDFFELFELESSDFKIKSLRGSNLVSANPAIKSFFDNFNIFYNKVFEKYIGDPICEVKNTKQVVGLLIKKRKGKIFVLPEASLIQDDDISIFPFIDLVNDKSFIFKNTTKSELPTWCEEIHFGNELIERQKLNDLKIELENIEDLLEIQHENLEEYNNLKRLLITSGNELEQLVEGVFIKFGYNVHKPDGHRDDLIIKYADDVAVLEIKGVKGSAAEKHAAQLMKWVNNYHLDNNINPKGILIVNSFMDLPIELRNSATFPHQMISYCNRMQLCLITSEQLLNLFIDFKFNRKSIDEIHNKLFSKIGIFES